MLAARDVEEALKERLLRGAYPRGGALPSVRALAAELGTSPSTVGRAVQELARQGRAIPIVFITAQGDASLRPRLLARGAVACLFKPFSDTALIDALNAALGLK